MSGHSKWHNIQKTKGAQDAKRAAAFTKISKEMIVAVKEGGGIADPAYNSRLATVITKAKAANMPNDNIKRTIDKALGSGNTDNYDLARLWAAPEDIRALKLRLLAAVFRLAQGRPDACAQEVIDQALFVLAEDWDEELLAPVVKRAEDCCAG